MVTMTIIGVFFINKWSVASEVIANNIQLQTNEYAFQLQDLATRYEIKNDCSCMYVILSVCLCVHTIKPKQLKINSPNLT